MHSAPHCSPGQGQGVRSDLIRGSDVPGLHTGYQSKPRRFFLGANIFKSNE